MRNFKNASKNWLCNAKKDHSPLYIYDLRGHIQTHEQCHCVECLKKEDASITIGDPIQVHEGFPIKLLKKLGYVGVYND